MVIVSPEREIEQGRVKLANSKVLFRSLSWINQLLLNLVHQFIFSFNSITAPLTYTNFLCTLSLVALKNQLHFLILRLKL